MFYKTLKAGFELVGPLLLGGIRDKCRMQTVVGQGVGLLRRQAQSLRGLHIVVTHIATELGRIIGIDRDAQACVQHLPQRMVCQGVKHAQLHIGKRAHGERDLVLG